jgi:hypothetical protein
MKTRSAVLALVALATAVTLTSVAAARPDGAKQRVAIIMKDLPDGTFVLAPLDSGPLKRDTGTTAVDIGGPDVVLQQGQAVEIFNLTWTLKGKRGTLTIRERNEWVDAGQPYVGRGFWKIVRGTGAYAHVTGGGRSASAGLDRANGAWYARQEGYLTVP